MPEQFWDSTSSFGAFPGPCIYRRYRCTHISRYYLLLSSTPTSITTLTVYFVTIALYPLAVAAFYNL
jgi:hypothetical protein